MPTLWAPQRYGFHVASACNCFRRGIKREDVTSRYCASRAQGVVIYHTPGRWLYHNGRKSLIDPLWGLYSKNTCWIKYLQRHCLQKASDKKYTLGGLVNLCSLAHVILSDQLDQVRKLLSVGMRRFSLWEGQTGWWTPEVSKREFCLMVKKTISRATLDSNPLACPQV